MAHENFVRSADAITCQWMNTMLHRVGLLEEPTTTVSHCSVTPVGTGQMGDVVRAELIYSAKTSAPKTIIAKISAQDSISRQTAISLGVYQNEVRFYNEIAPHTQMTVPSCYHAAIDEQEGWVTLLMEDVGINAKQGDVLAGGTVAQATLAFEQLALLQAPFWNDNNLATCEWLPPERSEMLFSVIPPLTEAFIKRFGHHLDLRHIELIKILMPKAVEWYRSWTQPLTISHGDFRLDNMMLACNDNAPPVMTIDWQTVKMAPPTMDIAYYLGACLSVEDRLAEQQNLLQGYQAALAEQSIDYPWEQLWLDHRRYSIYGLLLCAYALKVEQTERGDQMFAAATRSYADLALEIDALGAQTFNT